MVEGLLAFQLIRRGEAALACRGERQKAHPAKHDETARSVPVAL